MQVFDASHYEILLRQGLDFFGAARFNAVPERWWRGGGTGCSGMSSQYAPGQDGNSSATSNVQAVDGVLQCYRCQGFWHVAANCRHLPRCVRCGEPHSVEFCPRPRNNPICCHCSGPHHAGRFLNGQSTTIRSVFLNLVVSLSFVTSVIYVARATVRGDSY